MGGLCLKFPLTISGRVRIDDWEMRSDVQEEVRHLWEQVDSGNLPKVADIQGYNDDFLKLFGFGFQGVDYDADVDPLKCLCRSFLKINSLLFRYCDIIGTIQEPITLINGGIMIDYLLTEEQTMIRDLARQITDEKIRPVAAEYDRSEKFPWDIMKVIAQSDLFGVYIEEKYGGMGGGILELCLATEEFSKGCAGIAICYSASALGTYPIILAGSEEQKKKYLPAIAKGEKLAAFGLTEPAAGSDASALQTTAEKKGDHYILNGVKHFITNGGDAEIYTIIAMTDKSRGARGASLFVVEKGTPGFSFGKKEDKMGIRASSTRELIFDNCKIPAENLIGEGRDGIHFCDEDV